ncbi:DUF3795 domain-containing protein, partial [Candidatus Bathyarchaeota archaeon]|nr:DUF3795 domain-containing protein [Candidatus Bathyarchaeota archaeon]
KNIRPNVEKRCKPWETEFCEVASCPFNKGVRVCFECSDFSCDTTKLGPINYGFCQYMYSSPA